MYLLDLTLSTAAANLALDEALVEEAEETGSSAEVLRLWEPEKPLVVLGRSSRPELEVDLDWCAGQGIPVLRRTSGGASIVTGPGCLMYSVVLSIERRPELKSIDQAHCFVLKRLIEALSGIAPVAARCGTSDLAIDTSGAFSNAADEETLRGAAKKFSGNSLRAKRRHLLYHGTLLFDFDLELVSRCLKHPPREPGYRAGRTHAEFIANLPATREQLRAALVKEWRATEVLSEWPRERTEALVGEKYAREGWNLRGQS
ncbi:MAG TPA: lipoate--protein ligase family protein [Pirellulales bacterium]